MADLPLNTGNSIPQVGLGLWKIRDTAAFDASITAAITAGYRHFDTAEAYGNEHLLGNALKASQLRRQDVFITTKIAVQNFGHVRKHALTSLEDLQTDYVDLLLLHFPVPLLRRHAWKQLEKLYNEGKAKQIGVSNYTIRHLEQLRKYATITPAVNQVEIHVFLQQPELIAYCHDNGIVVEAYSPLAHARSNDNPVIQQLADKHHKSYAQVMLRWCIQKGLVILPKSVTPGRIKQNIALYDFALSDEDMTLLTGQDRNLRTCWNPTRVP